MHLVIACAAELAQFVLATPPLSCAVIVRVCWLYEFHLRAERAIETRSLAAFVLRVAWALLLLPIVGTTCARWYGASAWAARAPLCAAAAATPGARGPLRAARRLLRLLRRLARVISRRPPPCAPPPPPAGLAAVVDWFEKDVTRCFAVLRAAVAVARAGGGARRRGAKTTPGPS